MTPHKNFLVPGIVSLFFMVPLTAIAESTHTGTTTKITSLVNLALPYGISLALAILILIGGTIVSKIIVHIMRKLLTKRKIEATIVKFFCRLMHAILLIFVVLATLSKLGVQTASLVAILGAMSLAVGLSLKSSLSNLASGLLLILFRPFKTGEYIKISNVEGTVDEINLLYTEMVTPNNQLLVIPNSKFMSDIIFNFSAKEFRRCDLTIGIGYNDSVDKAKAVLTAILQADERVIHEPNEPLIAVNALGDSSVDIIVQYWTRRSDFISVKRQVIETIKQRFDEEGINIPYPQMDIHVIKEQS